MKPQIASSDQFVPFAFIHHANQLMITDGYQDRQGIAKIVGIEASQTGLTRVLELHKQYRVPLNIHITGIFLEALAWHCPDFLSRLVELEKLGLLELVGSAYAQNMMRFFSREHNLRQLREELILYQSLLDWDPETVKVFWPPERLWDTTSLAPVITSHTLPNKGYGYIIVDDRLLYPDNGSPSRRQLYDQEQGWDPTNFQIYQVENGHSLYALPIANNLRQNIPPRRPENLDRVKAQLHWLLDLNKNHSNNLIAIYGDDMEKAAGAGWDPKGPEQYKILLEWVASNHWIRPVKIGKWAETHKSTVKRQIDTGTYAELANEFEAGETYDKWYHDPRWTPYKTQYEWAENLVQRLETQGSDPALIGLAWKTLLATSWQTAWHTPRKGAHGDPDSDTGPSAWVKAITSHSRLAAIIAQAAHWVQHKDGRGHAYSEDLDHDGQEELVLKNNQLFAVLSPQNGGRLVYLFTLSEPGKVVIGNPIDDWNLLEELHSYMDTPPNHPGALTDLGHEHDTYTATIHRPTGVEVRAKLQNVQKDSPALGAEKHLTLRKDDRTIRVDYKLPSKVYRFSVEVGLSPDYPELLRHGQKDIREYRPRVNVQGWTRKDVTVWAKIQPGHVFWDSPRQPRFGHGYLLRVTSYTPNFTVWLGVDKAN